MGVSREFDNAIDFIPMKSIALLENLWKRRDKIGEINPIVFGEARLSINDHEFPSSFFVNHAAIKLANICWVFDLEGDRRPSADPRFSSDGYEFTFCDICGGPGSFTEYFQWRHPNSRGFGMTLESFDNPDDSRNWKRNVIEMNKFDIIEGPNRGDILVGWSKLLEKAASSGQVQMMTADGYMSGDYNKNYQEIFNTRIIATEIMVGLNTVAKGGHFILKIFDNTTKIMGDLIYILSMAYEDVYIFKPCSSRPLNSERYVVCKNKYGKDIDISGIVEVLGKVLDIFNKKMYVSRIFEDLPDEFVEWLDNGMEISIGWQNYHHDKLDDYISGKFVKNPGDLDRYLLLWGLPSSMVFSVDMELSRNRNVAIREKEAKSSRNKLEIDSQQSMVVQKMSIKYSKGIDGKTLFGVFRGFLRDTIRSIDDKNEKAKVIAAFYTKAMDFCMGKEQDMRVDTTAPKKWLHTVRDGYYTFTYGILSAKYPSGRIDELIEAVGGIGRMNAIYDLVERYYPFHLFGFTTDSKIAGIEAFASPLTVANQKVKYCSFFDEDKIFGSYGRFFDYYPRAGIWQILCPRSTFIIKRIRDILADSTMGTTVHILIQNTDTIFKPTVDAKWGGKQEPVILLDSKKGETIEKSNYTYGMRRY
jgi:23S rRNA U2552 (ribose-2'-O)-methylase RlmE/FtsJ